MSSSSCDDCCCKNESLQRVLYIFSQSIVAYKFISTGFRCFGMRNILHIALSLRLPMNCPACSHRSSITCVFFCCCLWIKYLKRWLFDVIFWLLRNQNVNLYGRAVRFMFLFAMLLIASKVKFILVLPMNPTIDSKLKRRVLISKDAVFSIVVLDATRRFSEVAV